MQTTFVEEIDPPIELKKPIVIRDSLLMIAGPTNMADRVRNAMTLPLVRPLDPQFFQVMREVSAGIRYVFQTRNQYSLAITGSGTCATETAIINLLEPNETLLVLVHGVWGKRVAIIGRKHGFNVIEVKVNSFGDVFNIKQIEDAIITYTPQLLFVCHGDSSVGTLQPLDRIGSICHQNGCLLLVDAVLSLCCAPLAMDRQEIDALVSGGQKALSGPPGVSIISLSERAVNRIKSRKTEVDSFYMDINWLAKAWGLDSDTNYKFVYHYTPAMPLLYALREALALVAEEGLHNVIERHMKNSLIVQKHIKSIGLSFLVQKSEHILPAVLPVLIPNGVSAEEVTKYLVDFYNISISGGLGPTMGKVWRLGILGVNANPKSVGLLCEAFSQAINEQKCKNNSII